MPSPDYDARPGDFYRICARTGFKVLARDTVKEWTGQCVRRESYEARHPQDFLRARKDDQRVRDPRPEPADDFLTTNEVTRDDL